MSIGLMHKVWALIDEDGMISQIIYNPEEYDINLENLASKRKVEHIISITSTELKSLQNLDKKPQEILNKINLRITGLIRKNWVLFDFNWLISKSDISQINQIDNWINATTRAVI